VKTGICITNCRQTTQADYVNAFFSHDEYIDFYAVLDENLVGIRNEFGTTEHQTTS